MKYLISIAFLFLTINVKSQNQSKDQIVGDWKVTNVIVKSTDKNKIDLANSFKNSIFSFKPNDYFSFTSAEKSKLIMMVVEQLKNKKWLFEEKSQTIRIGSAKDSYSIMFILPKIENNKASFEIGETEINLELIKI
ncbi:hypothetical protein C3L50_05055 [Flavobacterium alvei]|uniref:Lipocalin-like domain-containing protein n=1 Tax=Flavobacterium alvei TaxID=2080416 RepID=A0A2S5AED5_9FLAO|nr:hypothetical protein [Flavobacterium alvei]POY40866.1 hypothetical protein C3L50_05055 [Flavobacterium alvei]